jgi:hypothetical protein
LRAIIRTFSGDEITSKVVNWSSSNPHVASISSDGVLTATSVGSTTVIAENEGVTAAVSISVTTPLANGTSAVFGALVDAATLEPIGGEYSLVRVIINPIDATGPAASLASYDKLTGAFKSPTLQPGIHRVQVSVVHPYTGVFSGLNLYSDTTLFIRVEEGATTVVSPLRLRPRTPILLVGINSCPWVMSEPPTDEEWNNCDSGWWGGVDLRVSVTGVNGTPTEGLHHELVIGYNRYTSFFPYPWDRNNFSAYVPVQPGDYDVTLTRVEPAVSGAPWKIAFGASPTRRVRVAGGIGYTEWTIYRTY